MARSLPSTDPRRAAAAARRARPDGLGHHARVGGRDRAGLLRAGPARDRGGPRRGDDDPARPHGRARRTGLRRHPGHPAAVAAGRDRHAGPRSRGVADRGDARPRSYPGRRDRRRPGGRLRDRRGHSRPARSGSPTSSRWIPAPTTSNGHPAGSSSTEPPPAPVAGHQVVTAASAGSTVLQVAPALGLEPGDQVRILGSRPTASPSVDRDLVTLRDPLESAVPAGTPLESHRGAGDLHPAEPPGARGVRRSQLAAEPRATGTRSSSCSRRRASPGRLAGLDLAVRDVGDPEGRGRTGVARPRARRRLGHHPDPAQALAGNGREGRGRGPEEPLAPDRAPGADHDGRRDGPRRPRRAAGRVRDVRLGPPTPVGSTTITNAFHNAAPLAVTGRFLPFGPTPARFDIFSLAAPEALSKPGARVDLEVRLADASLLTLVDAAGRRAGSARARPAYGIGADGLLHSLTISPRADVRGGRCPTRPTADGAPVLLDGSAGLLARASRQSCSCHVDVARGPRSRAAALVHRGSSTAVQPARGSQVPADARRPAAR